MAQGGVPRKALQDFVRKDLANETDSPVPADFGTVRNGEPARILAAMLLGEEPLRRVTRRMGLTEDGEDPAHR